MYIKELQAELAKIEDPRRTKCGHIRHKLEDIIIIGLCTLLCDGSDFADMAEFGKAREKWLGQFLELPNGIPDNDTLNHLERIAYAIRKHWSIENQLHWCLDVIFDEDSSRGRKDNSPLNLNILRKAALVLCKNTDMGKCVTPQKKRFRAALNPSAFRPLLFG